MTSVATSPAQRQVAKSFQADRRAIDTSIVPNHRYTITPHGSPRSPQTAPLSSPGAQRRFMRLKLSSPEAPKRMARDAACRRSSQAPRSVHLPRSSQKRSKAQDTAAPDFHSTGF
ncbi:hypothetical protein CC85DRAFT_285920 [Cutaneotrichosporon oleaginosum]|uniref:Uncharacterized protein n=1 Tax=Cutaneotrichosporon oleaginosum TaxID=879819 RepID=A0A0J0XLM3_9TREE|nr:uncharacterized protein CC85DRAFT_285920 [Cutaneotrichosporon oleaginosum]KLT41987.1 hypothetical protein CC85DRAFT_285920 [Cutaneotrichosporon oleaginosum]TXT14354.1 hypothetical protein COLE_00547 [Cutaneotrichosporon oleaginosum]